MANENDEIDSDTFDEEAELRTWRESAAFRRASFHAPDEIWNMFSEADDCCDIIDYFKALVKSLNIDPLLHGIEFYEILKSKLTSWKCQSLWDLLNSRLKHSEYNKGTVAKGSKCLIIGAGPIGLRMAIEALLLGCKTVVVDRRTEFTRNNVLHLWPFLLDDFKALGAKKFYGKFASGCIDHIKDLSTYSYCKVHKCDDPQEKACFRCWHQSSDIKTLQCVLLKISLLLGLEIHVGVTFKSLVEPVDEQSGWKAVYEPENHEVSKFTFNIVIGADGKKNVLPGFQQIELRGALAIGITCNFVNNNTIEEARVPEISGISYQYNPAFFDDMEKQYGVKLENIVYYKDETHYFVMTALKSSLLNLGVLKQDTSDPRELVTNANIDTEKLIDFTRYAVNHATNNLLPEDLEFKILSNGKPDIALFDFTSIKKASNASRIIERKKQRLLVALVGDSLIEPFWPTGSGCGRGVLSALDVAWMIRQFTLKHPPLAILRERENIFKLLSATTADSLQKNYKQFTIDPKTRYSGFDTKRVSCMISLRGLYDIDDQESADFTVASPVNEEKRRPRKRSTSGGNIKKPSSHVNLHTHHKQKRKSDRAVLKEQAPVGNTKQFWEEHNKKNLDEKAKDFVPKKKASVISNGDDVSDFSEIDDDVVEDKPVLKKGFQDNKAIKRQLSREESHGHKKSLYKTGGLKNRSASLEHSKNKTPEKNEGRSRKKSLSKKSPRKKSVSKKEAKEVKKEEKPEPIKKEPPRYVTSSIRSSTQTSSRNLSTGQGGIERKLRRNVSQRSTVARSSSSQLSDSEKKISTVKRSNSGRKLIRKASIKKRESLGALSKSNQLTSSKRTMNRSATQSTANKRESSKCLRKSGVKTRSQSKLELSGNTASDTAKQLHSSSGLDGAEIVQRDQRKSKIPVRKCKKRTRSVIDSISEYPQMKLPKEDLNLPSILVSSFEQLHHAKEQPQDTLILPTIQLKTTNKTRSCPLGELNHSPAPSRKEMIGKFQFLTTLSTDFGFTENMETTRDNLFESIVEERENVDSPMQGSSSSVINNEQTGRPRHFRKNLPSNFRNVRLRSIPKRRQSMLRSYHLKK